jgi:hypothetical protein
MHRCLHIHEIAQLICAHISTKNRLSRRSLARLALTCRLFGKLANDELWSKLPESVGLDPLFEGMADDLWVKGNSHAVFCDAHGDRYRVNGRVRAL